MHYHLRHNQRGVRMRRQGPRTQDKTANYLLRCWAGVWIVISHKGTSCQISKAVVHLAHVIDPILDEFKFVISPKVFEGSRKIARPHLKLDITSQPYKPGRLLPAAVALTKSKVTGNLKYIVTFQTSDGKRYKITFSGPTLLSTRATTPKQSVRLLVNNVSTIIAHTINELLEMPDSKKPDASKGPGRAYGPPTESRKSSSSKEQPERPPSRGLFSRMRSNSSLSKTRSGEEAPQLDTLQPQRPPSRSRNLFSHSSSSTIVAKPISKDELSQLNSAMSRPSSKLSFNSPKSPGVASPSEDQSSNRNKFSRWLRKDTPIVVEVPKKEFVFVENEALVALTPIERRAIRKAPVYVKTIVPRYRVPANTRRNSIDFNCYEDLFTQVCIFLTKHMAFLFYANLPV